MTVRHFPELTSQAQTGDKKTEKFIPSFDSLVVRTRCRRTFLMITYITAFKSSQIDVYKVYLLIWYTDRWWLTTHSVHLIFPARAAWWHPPLRSLCPIWNRVFTAACLLSQTWACASLPGASCGSGVWQCRSPLLILSGVNLTNCKNPLTS